MGGFSVGQCHQGCEEQGVLRAEFSDHSRNEYAKVMFLRCDGCSALVDAALQHVTRKELCAVGVAESGYVPGASLKPRPTTCPSCQPRLQELVGVYLPDDRDDHQGGHFHGIDCLFCDRCCQMVWAASRLDQQAIEETERRRLRALIDQASPQVSDAINKP
jgi:hypothetical protein